MIILSTWFQKNLKIYLKVWIIFLRLTEEDKKVKIETEDGDFYDDIPTALQGYVAAIYEAEDTDE